MNTAILYRWPMDKGHANSIYLKLWERNHCNHRDYQNLGKNGADSFEANSKLIKSMARHQKLDQPALVFYSLIGNDVCHGGHDLHKMTTPEEMHNNVMETLQSLDKRLPNGSHVIIIGLVDGRILYDSLHNRIHPIGKLRGDVTYEQFYNFMNCLQISPCFGFMNSNETIRNETSERSAQLSAVLKNVAETTKFENFDVFFFDCPLEQVIKVNRHIQTSFCFLMTWDQAQFSFRFVITFWQARRNENRGPILAVAVRENVWELLKLGLISG